jgi:DNA-binding response OmpR family regulator
MANILIIEDEVNVSSFIKRGLEEEGHTTGIAYDGALGLRLACSNEFDIIVLDVVLPQMNGLEVCRQYRKKIGFTVPILMLTALSTTDDIVNGIETGADDYLVKPFKFKELLARINSLLRRKSIGYTSKKFQFADLNMDSDSKTVTRSGHIVELTSKEFRLLEFFMANPCRVLSRTTILENVWGKNIELYTNIVDVYVNYLRNKVDKGFQRKLIHTVIGMGYVLKEE